MVLSLPDMPDIVISSSWRMYGLEFCKSELLSAGLDARVSDLIKDVTGDSHTRAHEIFNYCEEKNIQEYLILDDESFSLIGPNNILIDKDLELFIKRGLVLTNFEFGFNDKVMTRCISKFF